MRLYNDVIQESHLVYRDHTEHSNINTHHLIGHAKLAVQLPPHVVDALHHHVQAVAQRAKRAAHVVLAVFERPAK